jgi:hypothetical protein
MNNRNSKYAYELLEETGQQKKVDINRAIMLYEEAIPINKKEFHYYYLQLASCYFEVNNPDKAYLVLSNYLRYLDNRKFYTLSQFEKSDIFHKISVLLYKEHRYLEYIYYYSLMRYNKDLAIFTMGRIGDYRRLKRTSELYKQFYSFKLSTCFKRIDKLDKLKDFERTYVDYFKGKDRILMQILQKSSQALLGNNLDDDGKKMSHSNIDKQSFILRNDQEFLNTLKQVSESDFIDYYNKQLLPLISV